MVSGHPSAAGRAKVRLSETDVLPLCHATRGKRLRILWRCFFTTEPDFWSISWLNRFCKKSPVNSIDNRILIFWTAYWLDFRLAKMSPISLAEMWRTPRKTDCYWAEEYTTSQLRRCSRAEVNKFLLAYVILFKHVYFRQYFACLRAKIFNCCNVSQSER